MIVGVVLSGGAGRRFGGKDKGLVHFRGKPLVQWVIDTLRPQVSDLILCVNRNLHDYKGIHPWVVCDEEQSFDGPLAGIVAAIEELEQTSEKPDYIVICTCDTPYLGRHFVATLQAAIANSTQQVAVAHDGDRRQNLHCMISVDAFASLKQFYAQGGRAIHRWFDDIGCLDVDFSAHAEEFKNFNSPTQLLEQRP